MITLHETWLLYLRKSRQDDPHETVEEVLAKHETQLQEYAERELGGRIPEEHIYREIGSGESISERQEIKKILARLEDPAVKGVLCMEPSRLSRGDLSDCAKIIDSFRYTHSLVCTPYMTYDLEKKMERKFFQDELLRGNDYLEYTKEILHRGRVASIKRGCYIGNTPPFGYKKIKIGKDHTLEIIEDQAEVVRLIFDLYTKEGLTPGRIAQRLDSMGIKPAKSEKWPKDSVRTILRNVHYIGKVRYNYVKRVPVLENGEVVKKRLSQPEEEVIIAEGKHQAIIDRETWEAAQAVIANNPKTRYDRAIRNVLSGVLVCGRCGRAMHVHPYKHAEDRFECYSRPRCYKSVKESELLDAVIFALEEAELPNLELKVKNGDGNARRIQQRLLEKLEKEMDDYRAQEERQFELLETSPQYTQDVFERRNAALRAKMEACQSAIYKAKAALPPEVDYEEKIIALKDAIAALRSEDMICANKNRIIRAIVEKVVYKGPEPVKERKGRAEQSEPFSLEVYLRL